MASQLIVMAAPTRGQVQITDIENMHGTMRYSKVTADGEFVQVGQGYVTLYNTFCATWDSYLH